MEGFVDVHSDAVPSGDDGARSIEEAVELCGLARAGGTRVLFATPHARRGSDNFRRREWSPAVDAAGVRRPATPYDLRHTFASNALHAGVTVFELARVMGTSVRMIEKHYGTLVDGAHAGILVRLDAVAGGES